jgi:hypothetical protein
MMRVIRMVGPIHLERARPDRIPALYGNKCEPNAQLVLKSSTSDSDAAHLLVTVATHSARNKEQLRVIRRLLPGSNRARRTTGRYSAKGSDSIADR